MGVCENARIERLYREIRTLTAMRLKAVTAHDRPWAEVLTMTRKARVEELSAVCAAALAARPGGFSRAA